MDSAADPQTVQRYVEQAQRKRNYNREYYHNKVKPKREQEKRELDQLRERNVQLETYIAQIQQNSQIVPDVSEERIKNLSKELDQVKEEKENLKKTITQLQRENNVLRESIEIARKRNYELMMERSDQLLPDLRGLTLNPS